MLKILAAPAFWCGCCVTGLILLVNRAVDLIDGRYAHALFGGSKTYVWLLIPICMLLYISFFTTPFMYNAIYDGGFLSPYAGVPEIEVDFSEYDNPLVGNFNYFVAVMYPLMYLVLCVIIWYKTKGGQGKVSLTQKQIVAQSVIVSTLLAIVSAAYIVMQYIETPRFFIVAIQFMWMASHGASVFTYIFVNKSMRKEACKMVKGWLRCGILPLTNEVTNLDSQQKSLTLPQKPQPHDISRETPMSITEDQLIQEAVAASENSYSPYSRFPVGAAVLTEDGTVFRGANVENASYGGTICAERSAIVSAVSAGHRKFKSIAIVTELDEPCTPCGICRQFIVEFGDVRVIMFSPSTGKRMVSTAYELLPRTFTPAHMDQHGKYKGQQ
ncbi:serpentine type 7TM GPCR chemoreceptor srt domain-containing protein [Ditylenchus destructor]|uniref:cytidine deaminase n=1 Tax=Ditylenchus destructor TaxID=166010 RepID=A0AAD4MZ51_9BILA|nr:serpentine type 7TM GPCR chemoreceptor srt domain-containing protein [Ditylenchus destructor]